MGWERFGAWKADIGQFQTCNNRDKRNAVFITTLTEVMTYNGPQTHGFAISVLKARTCRCTQHFTLRRGKRKLLSKLWCEAGDWGKFKGHVRETEGTSERRGGGEGGHLTRLLQGIARRLLIRTPANEVQGHLMHTNALNKSRYSCFTIKT